MKKTHPLLTLFLIMGAALVSGLPSSAASAESDQKADASRKSPGLTCVRASDIEQTQAVDPRTVVITLRQRGRYKRMDMDNTCGGLMFYGFAYATQVNELCNVDPIRVLDGEFCTIHDIVDISADEAKDLLHKKR